MTEILLVSGSSIKTFDLIDVMIHYLSLSITYILLVVLFYF
jgi:hypothetical protein